MTQVWPVLGVAPVPTTTSSYWSPLGSLSIFESPFFAVGSSALADRAQSARAAAPASRRDASFFIVWPFPFSSLCLRRKARDSNPARLAQEAFLARLCQAAAAPLSPIDSSVFAARLAVS